MPDFLLYEISNTYPFKNDSIILKDFALKPSDNFQHLEIITIIQKNSFIKELYLFSVFFQICAKFLPEKKIPRRFKNFMSLQILETS